MRVALNALPNTHALTLVNSMILETVHGILNDIIRIYNHTHFVQVQGKKKRQDNDSTTTVGLISGLA